MRLAAVISIASVPVPATMVGLGNSYKTGHGAIACKTSGSNSMGPGIISFLAFHFFLFLISALASIPSHLHKYIHRNKSNASKFTGIFIS
jgi:hypothetical protein